jgi:hypothetical protein
VVAVTIYEDGTLELNSKDYGGPEGQFAWRLEFSPQT